MDDPSEQTPSFAPKSSNEVCRIVYPPLKVRRAENNTSPIRFSLNLASVQNQSADSWNDTSNDTLNHLPAEVFKESMPFHKSESISTSNDFFSRSVSDDFGIYSVLQTEQANLQSTAVPFDDKEIGSHKSASTSQSDAADAVPAYLMPKPVLVPLEDEYAPLPECLEKDKKTCFHPNPLFLIFLTLSLCLFCSCMLWKFRLFPQAWLSFLDAQFLHFRDIIKDCLQKVILSGKG